MMTDKWLDGSRFARLNPVGAPRPDRVGLWGCYGLEVHVMEGNDRGNGCPAVSVALRHGLPQDSTITWRKANRLFIAEGKRGEPMTADLAERLLDKALKKTRSALQRTAHRLNQEFTLIEGQVRDVNNLF